MAFYRWRPYVSQAARRAQANRHLEKLRKKGKPVDPVCVEGRTICHSFWGRAWCDHLESFSDFENRLPRGRTYVRNGSVCHLEIHPGRIEALVSGSEIYRVKIGIKPLPATIWNHVQERCRGRIGSMIELLQGRLSEHVMQIVTDRREGLLPLPSQIELDCDCLDWATMCKHVAAVLYGVGNRLDREPEILFSLRGVEAALLIDNNLAGALPPPSPDAESAIAEDQLASVFGVEFDADVAPPQPKSKAAKPKTPKRTTRHRPKPTPPEPPFQPTGPEIARMRNRLNLSVREFAESLEISAATVYRWEKSSGPLKMHATTSEALARLRQALPEIQATTQ